MRPPEYVVVPSQRPKNRNRVDVDSSTKLIDGDHEIGEARQGWATENICL